MPATYDVGQVSDADLLRIFPVAIIVIGLLLALVLRSLIAPLYLIASVAISYLAACGLSVLLFQDAGRAGGLSYVIPFLMFIFLLALGEDYNILVMTRIREEASRVPLRQAVTRGPGAHRPDGQLGRARPGRHLRRLRPGSRQRSPAAARTGRPRVDRDRHPHGRLPRPHPARPRHRRPARPLELVAIRHGSPAREVSSGRRLAGTHER